MYRNQCMINKYDVGFTGRYEGMMYHSLEDMKV